MHFLLSLIKLDASVSAYLTKVVNLHVNALNEKLFEMAGIDHRVLVLITLKLMALTQG